MLHVAKNLKFPWTVACVGDTSTKNQVNILIRYRDLGISFYSNFAAKWMHLITVNVIINSLACNMC